MADAKDRNTPPGPWAPLWEALAPLVDVVREAWDDAKAEDAGPEESDAKRPDGEADKWAGHEHPPHVMCTVLCRAWTRVQEDKVDADPTRRGGTLDPTRLIDVENYLHAALSSGITSPLDLRPTIDGRAYGLYAADLREVVVLAREGLAARVKGGGVPEVTEPTVIYPSGQRRSLAEILAEDDDLVDATVEDADAPPSRLTMGDVEAIHDVVMTSVHDAIAGAFRDALPLVQTLVVHADASNGQATEDVTHDGVKGSPEREGTSPVTEGASPVTHPHGLDVNKDGVRVSLTRRAYAVDGGWVGAENGVWLPGIRASADLWADDRLPDYLDPRDPDARVGRYDGAVLTESERWHATEAERNARLRATAMADQHRIGANPPDRIPGVRVALCLDLDCAARYDADAEHTGPACAGEPSKTDADAAGPSVREPVHSYVPGDPYDGGALLSVCGDTGRVTGSDVTCEGCIERLRGAQPPRTEPFDKGGVAAKPTTMAQNGRGEWVPAIPEATWRGKRHVCDCGVTRKTREAYREHYAYAHVLAYT